MLFNYLRTEISPVIAAASTLLVFGVLVAAAIGVAVQAAIARRRTAADSGASRKSDQWERE